MVGAIVKDNVCVNVANFDNGETLQLFGAIEIPSGYGIGDLFDGENWSKRPLPEPEPPSVEMQIATLKTQLTDTDYQIIKAYEYALVGLEVEYDIEALHAERQAIRDEINALEAQEGQ